MYLLAVERAAVHAIMTAALAGAISHVLYIVADLDNCFWGDWRVERTAFERVKRYLVNRQARATQGASAGTSRNG
jgi:hypothetical protein